MNRRPSTPQMQKLLAAVRAMGWTIEIPIVEGLGGIPGAIIGTKVFVDVVKESLANELYEDEAKVSEE